MKARARLIDLVNKPVNRFDRYRELLIVVRIVIVIPVVRPLWEIITTYWTMLRRLLD
jgi:hypothetical protein